jgi:hypothetical protein
LRHKRSKPPQTYTTGSVSAVSDNTRHRSSCRPTSNVTNKPKQKSSSTNPPIDSTTDSSTRTDATTINISLLPVIPEDSDLSSSLPCEILSSPIDHPPTSPTHRSPKQTQDILQKVTQHLELHGQITPDLLKMLDINKSHSKITTSTTPINRPPPYCQVIKCPALPLHPRGSQFNNYLGTLGSAPSKTGIFYTTFVNPIFHL